MLVCPVTTKIDEDSQKSGEECFIPAGIWTDIFTGDVYNGGKMEKVRFYVEIFKVFLCLDVQVQ